jgi:hypothetical protein
MNIDLTTIVETNAKAAQMIADMNIAVIAKKFGLTLAQAQTLRNQTAINLMTRHSETV